MAKETKVPEQVTPVEEPIKTVMEELEVKPPEIINELNPDEIKTLKEKISKEIGYPLDKLKFRKIVLGGQAFYIRQMMNSEYKEILRKGVTMSEEDMESYIVSMFTVHPQITEETLKITPAGFIDAISTNITNFSGFYVPIIEEI